MLCLKSPQSVMQPSAAPRYKAPHLTIESPVRVQLDKSRLSTCHAGGIIVYYYVKPSYASSWAAVAAYGSSRAGAISCRALRRRRGTQAAARVISPPPPGRGVFIVSVPGVKKWEPFV